MKKMTKTALAMLLAGAGLASAQEETGCSPTGPCPLASSEPRGGWHHDRDARAVRVWDPYLAQWRVETPGRVWDPNLARYQQERRDQVWDPYLAQYRPRDARRDGPAPADREIDRRADGRHRHPGQQAWCFARH
jgi:hypothetical protein